MTILAFALAATACSNSSSPRDEETGIAPGSQITHGTDSPLPRMVAIHAQYCAVCAQMKPVLDKLADQCDGKGLQMELIDVSKANNEHFIDDYRVVGLPTYLFIGPDGYEVARLVGRQTESSIKQAIGALRGEACPGVTPLPGRQKANKEIVSCPSTNTFATTAMIGSKSSKALPTKTR